MQKLPPTVPRNPLQFVSCNIIFRFVPGRMLESELTSSMAATIAGFTDRPMTEFNVNRAPKLTTLGLGKELLVSPVTLVTSASTQIERITVYTEMRRSIWLFIVEKVRN